MSAQAVLMTPKNLYRLLKGEFKSINGPVFLIEDKNRAGTLSRFWWNALKGIAPGEVLDPVFCVTEVRSRSLSNIMNRSRAHALPVKLREALKKGLHPDSFHGLGSWLYSLLDQKVSVSAAHQALTELEDLCFQQDAVFGRLRSFFQNMRVDAQKLKESREKGFFLLAYRLSWLCLHAVFGDDMELSEL